MSGFDTWHDGDTVAGYEFPDVVGKKIDEFARMLVKSV